MNPYLAMCLDCVAACWSVLRTCLIAIWRFLYNILVDYGCKDRRKHSMYTNHICLVSRNKTFLGAVNRALQRMDLCDHTGVQVTISERHISAPPGSSFRNENFDGARLVIFIVLSEPRMQIISSTEESSIGDIYRRAQLSSVESMVVLVGHTNSDGLSEGQLYHPTLESVCVNQPDIGTLARNERFLSLGYLYNQGAFDFNGAQKEALVKWARSMIPGCIYRKPFKS